jgi:nitrogen fixation negative regulator NifL
MKKKMHYLSTHTDINECLFPGEEREAYELFLEAVEQAPVAIIITDKKAKILYVNDAFTKTTGYLPSETLGENPSFLSDKSTPKSIYHDLWNTISHKQNWSGQLINRHKSGDRYLADLVIAPILNQQGAITYYIGMHKDVTAGYENEKRAINQKLLTESVINSSPIAMVVLDEEDRVILDNQLYKTLISDLGKGEPAHYFLQLLREEMGDMWQQLQLQQKGFTNREFRVEIKGSQGVRWFSCAGNWIIGNEVNADAFFEQASKCYLVLTLSDISKQRRQMEELHIQTLRAMMTEDERVRSIRETLLGAIHQIQMPMNQIMAAEQILHHKNKEDNRHLIDILQRIQKSGEEAIATMHHCLPEILQSTITSVNLNQILHEVLLLNAQRLLTHNIEVCWNPLPNLPAISGSENRLRLLFNQLIDNSIVAMSQINGVAHQLTISTSKDSNLVYVRIEDTGAGIPVDKRSKIFEPFYTTRQKGGNQAGMGLVMVKEIVNQHHGLIDIDSSSEPGCRFQLSFPCSKSQTGART